MGVGVLKPLSCSARTRDGLTPVVSRMEFRATYQELAMMTGTFSSSSSPSESWRGKRRLRLGSNQPGKLWQPLSTKLT